jgi:hypothetical protein
MDCLRFLDVRFQRRGLDRPLSGPCSTRQALASMLTGWVATVLATGSCAAHLLRLGALA